MKLLATADLHLGKTSSALGSGLTHAFTRTAWERLVTLAIDQQADALLITGDLVDRDIRFFEAQDALISGFERLRGAAIPVLLTAGNHDFEALGNILSNYAADHVHLLGAGGTWQTCDLVLQNIPVRFLGWSFPRRHVSTDPLVELDPALHPGDMLTIGLVHGDYGIPESTYAPLSEQSFARDGIDAWVLGHIHKPAILRPAHPLILYPGSPQALSSKETGIHGPWILEITGRTVTHRHIPISPVRYETLEVRVDGVSDQSAYYAAITEAVLRFLSQESPSLGHVHSLVVDLHVTGRPRNPAAFRRYMDSLVSDQDDLQHSFQAGGLGDFSGISLRIRSVFDRLQPPEADLNSLIREPGPAGLLARVIRALDARSPVADAETVRGSAENAKAVADADAQKGTGAAEVTAEEVKEATGAAACETPHDEQTQRILDALLKEAAGRIDKLNRNGSFADLRPNPERPYFDAVHVDQTNCQQVSVHAKKEALRLLDTLLETHAGHRSEP